ncbi:MAG: hypothetical protein K2Y37_10435 [Pirellulales bacterium]|nr:hypothetical protein [Pirellulales bacterium]
MSQPMMTPPTPPPTPPRRIWPWLLGAGCGVALLLCCGFVGFFGYMGAKVAQGMSQDPTKVREVAKSIVEIDLPPEFAPQMSMDLPVPTMHMTFAVFGNGPNMVMLGKMRGAAFAKGDAEMMARQMEQSIQARSSGRETLEAENSEEREFTIRDKPVKFTITEGTGANSSKKLVEAMGAFPADGGFIIIVIQVDAEQYSKERVVEVIESIR